MSNLLRNEEIVRLAWCLYSNSPISIRLLASLRNYICPMQPLLASVPDNSTVFDIGCGSGLFLCLLVASGKITEITGTDVNAKALQSAKAAIKNLAEKEEKVSFNFIETNNINDWPKTDFSLVSMIDVMHHIQPAKQREVFEAAVDRVSPGGYLLYKDMCSRPLWKATGNRLHDLVLARQWIHYIPLERIKKWGQFLRLELIEESHYSRLFYGHEKLVFKKSIQ